MSRQVSQIARLLVVFLCIWIPFTIHWAQLPSESWVASPLWNSLYMFLVGAVVLVGWASKNESIKVCSLAILCLYALSRTIYGTEPEYHWFTPVIDCIAAAFFWHWRQRALAGVFALMVVHFLAAKFSGVSPFQWQIRNNLLFMLQCLTAIGIWSHYCLTSKQERVKKSPPDNLVKLVVNQEGTWPRMQSRG